MRAIVAYDIGDDDARARVAALLAGFGVRVQRSVFDCDFGEHGLEGVLAAVEVLIDVDEDSFDVFAACSGCVDRRWHVGQSRAGVMGAWWWVV